MKIVSQNKEIAMLKSRSKIMWTEMTRPELETYLNKNPNPVVIIPLGSIEQHGVQLPLGTDSLSAIEICKAIAKRSNSLVLPITWVGYSEHHMGFKGTITFSQDTLARIIMDVIKSLSRHGLKRVLIVNWHGGNKETLNFAVKESSKKYKVNIITDSQEPEDPNAFTTLRNFDIHAGNGETSFMLNLFPELVDTDKIKEWKPTVKLPKPIEKARKLCLERNENCQQLLKITMSYLPDTHKLTSSGVYGLTDIKDATKEEGKEFFDKVMNRLVNLIKLWDEVEK